MRKKVVFLPYDFDSAAGINNEGALAFSYNLEDIDKTESGADVFNGQQSVLWQNLRAAFFKELAAMYKELRSTGALSYAKVEQMFSSHQSHWPEAIFNEDAWFKYLAPLVEKGNASYLSMLLGSKEAQRRWWLYNRFRYIDSKYNAGDSLTDVITVRGYAKADIIVTPYADVYPTVKYGSYLVQDRGHRNTATLLECPLDNVNDTEIMIFSASQLKSIGDLSGLQIGYGDFTHGTRLQSLKLGDGSASYENLKLEELYLGNNVLLRTIDVRNCPSLTQAVDLSGCSNLETVLFEGTSVTGLNLPDGGILKTLYLPSTITNLTILNQPSIISFVVSDGNGASDFSNISTLRLENVSSVVDSLEIIQSIAPLSRVRLLGFSWSLPSTDAVEDIYDLLDTMRGLDENGGNVDKAQLHGTIHVPALSTDQQRALAARYSDITLTADVMSYRVRFFNGEQLLYTATIESGSPCPDPILNGIISTPEKAAQGNTAYAFNSWDTDLSSITTDLDVDCEWTETRAWSVTFKNYDGSILYTTLVAEGATCPDPVITGTIQKPLKPADENYVYSYLGWTGASLINVTSDRILTASYSQVASYTIRFVDWDGTEFCRYYLAAYQVIPDPFLTGDIPELPTRPEDPVGQYTYTWKGWDSTPGTVTGNRTFTATYTALKYYYVTFKNWDGTELLKVKVNSGGRCKDPLTTGELETPTRPPEETYGYLFLRWNYTFPLTYVSTNYNVTAQYSTDQVWTVTFNNYDGTTLDVQEVLDARDAVDPVTGGRIATPLKPSDVSYDYTFRGWNSSFTNIRANKTVTAQYTSTVRQYDVRFWDGDTLLATVSTPYNSSAVIPFEPEKEGYYLDDWNPACTYIRGDTDCYAQWLPVIQDDWAAILASEDDNTYKTRYSVGDIKMLDLGDEGSIAMQIVGFDKDTMEDDRIAPISWIARNAMKTARSFGWMKHNATSTNLNRFTRVNADPPYYTSYITSGASVNEFVVTASVPTDVTIRAYCSGSQYNDLFTVWVNEEVMADRIGSVAGETVEQTYHLGAGEFLTVFAQHTKYAYSSVGENRAKLWFLSEDELTVEMSNPTSTRSTAGCEGGYPTTPFRDYVNTEVLGMLPEVLRNAIKEVRKFSGLTKTTGVWSLEKVWVPSMVEINNARNDFKVEGPIYSDLFTSGSVSAIRNKGVPMTVFVRTMANGNIITTSGGGGWGSSQSPGAQRVWLGFCT